MASQTIFAQALYESAFQADGVKHVELVGPLIDVPADATRLLLTVDRTAFGGEEQNILKGRLRLSLDGGRTFSDPPQKGQISKDWRYGTFPQGFQANGVLVEKNAVVLPTFLVRELPEPGNPNRKIEFTLIPFKDFQTKVEITFDNAEINPKNLDVHHSVTVDNFNDSGDSGNVSSLSFSHSGGSPDYVAIIVGGGGVFGKPAATVTYGGDACTAIGEAYNDLSFVNPYAQGLFRVAPQSGTQTVQASFAASIVGRVGCLTANNVDQSTPTDDSDSAVTDVGASSTLTLTSATGNLAISTIASAAAIETTWGGTGTQLWSAAEGFGLAIGAQRYSGSSSVACAWTGTGGSADQHLAHFAWDIKEAGGGGGFNAAWASQRSRLLGGGMGLG